MVKDWLGFVIWLIRFVGAGRGAQFNGCRT
jgi:hypothetical protein